MKHVFLFVVAVAGLVTSLAAAQPVQIKLELKHADIDEKWLADLSRKSRERLPTEDESLTLPSVTARPGESATIKIIREVLAETRRQTPITACGVIARLTPQWKDGQLSLTGDYTLRRSLDKSDEGTATQFATRETLIDMDLENGEKASIDLGDGGELRITATLLDATGRPLRPEEDHDN